MEQSPGPLYLKTEGGFSVSGRYETLQVPSSTGGLIKLRSKVPIPIVLLCFFSCDSQRMSRSKEQ